MAGTVTCQKTMPRDCSRCVSVWLTTSSTSRPSLSQSRLKSLSTPIRRRPVMCCRIEPRATITCRMGKTISIMTPKRVQMEAMVSMMVTGQLWVAIWAHKIDSPVWTSRRLQCRWMLTTLHNCQRMSLFQSHLTVINRSQRIRMPVRRSR
jgi:hypothetical protein